MNPESSLSIHDARAFYLALARPDAAAATLNVPNLLTTLTNVATTFPMALRSQLERCCADYFDAARRDAGVEQTTMLLFSIGQYRESAISGETEDGLGYREEIARAALLDAFGDSPDAAGAQKFEEIAVNVDQLMARMAQRTADIHGEAAAGQDSGSREQYLPDDSRIPVGVVFEGEETGEFNCSVEYIENYMSYAFGISDFGELSWPTVLVADGGVRMTAGIDREDPYRRGYVRVSIDPGKRTEKNLRLLESARTKARVGMGAKVYFWQCGNGVYFEKGDEKTPRVWAAQLHSRISGIAVGEGWVRARNTRKTGTVFRVQAWGGEASAEIVYREIVDRCHMKRTAPPRPKTPAPPPPQLPRNAPAGADRRPAAETPWRGARPTAGASARRPGGEKPALGGRRLPKNFKEIAAQHNREVLLGTGSAYFEFVSIGKLPVIVPMDDGHRGCSVCDLVDQESERGRLKIEEHGGNELSAMLGEPIAVARFNPGNTGLKSTDRAFVQQCLESRGPR